MELLKIKINRKKQTLTLVYNKIWKGRIVKKYTIEDAEKFIPPSRKENINLLTGIELLYYIILKLEVLEGIIITRKNSKLKIIKVLNRIVKEKNVTYKTEKYKDDIYYARYMNIILWK